METLKRRFVEKYELVSTRTVRDFYYSIDWSDRLIGIKGQRGVGKTTLVLQYIKLNLKADHETLYTSLDHIYFSGRKLYDFAEAFVSKGGKYLFLDEIHRYKNWSVELKNIYDDFPALKIVFTGSSMLQIRKANADLSRRAVIYTMPGLSFREFIRFETKHHFKPHPFPDIIKDHTRIAAQITSEIKPLAYLDKYLEYGYYSFYLENKNTFYQRLNETINMVLEVDIPQYEEMQISHITKIKRLLTIISESVPFKPNMQKLAERSGISINTLKLYLQYLSEAEILTFLKSPGKGINTLSKPEKIYLDNTNLMILFGGQNVNTGTMRETFFLNQLAQREIINASPDTDFLVNNQFSFEVGGKNKTRKQIAGIKNGFIVKDNLEIGFDNQIPLWLFGFIY